MWFVCLFVCLLLLLLLCLVVACFELVSLFRACLVRVWGGGGGGGDELRVRRLGRSRGVCLITISSLESGLVLMTVGGRLPV